MVTGRGALGVDIKLMTPGSQMLHTRRPVEDGFADRLGKFLWSAAADFHPEVTLAPFHDSESQFSISVLGSTDFLITLQAEVVADSTNGVDDIDGINFECTRAALITASEQAYAFAGRGEDDWGIWCDEPVLPLDFFVDPAVQRLTGIYRTGRGVVPNGEMVAVTHYIQLGELAQAELEASFLTAHLPFSVIAAHGVNDRRQPWLMVTQILPIKARVDVAAPWNALQVAREEVHRAIACSGDARILGESVAVQEQLVGLLVARGVDQSLLSDWTVEELVLAGITELTNAPLSQVAAGRLIGCAFPDHPHDCPKDVFGCVFSRWQEMLFNAPEPDSPM